MRDPARVEVEEAVALVLGLIGGLYGLALYGAVQVVKERLPDDGRPISPEAERAVWRGRAVARPEEARRAVELSTALLDGLRGGWWIFLPFLPFALLAFGIAVAIGDSIFIALTVIVTLALGLGAAIALLLPAGSHPLCGQIASLSRASSLPNRRLPHPTGPRCPGWKLWRPPSGLCSLLASRSR